MSARRRRLRAQITLASLLAAALLAGGAGSGSAAEPTVETTGTSLATYAWSPSSVEIAGGASVAFKNPSATPHGLVWESGPETPGCTGTPTVGQGNWSGSCSFVQGGSYAFYCPVHPGQMRGTIVVNGPRAPAVTTAAASAIGESEATLNGSVNPFGQATSYYFEYGQTASYGTKTTETSAGEGSAAVAESATVGGLLAGTVYHFRLVAKNATGTTLGSDRTFSTTGPPSATTAAAAAIGDGGATLKGTVNPHGLATTYFFNFGISSAYGQQTGEVAAGSGTTAVPVSFGLAGLQPQTIYHFQLVAKNSAGTTLGADQSFETAAVPPSEPPPEPEPETTPADPPALPASTLAAPETKITLKPRARSRDRTPTLKFVATVAGATYRCSLDGKPFKSCRSPFTSPALKPGRHTIRIAATANGQTDLSPARASFTILAAKKRR